MLRKAVCRGLAWCTNAAGEGGNCCCDYANDLDVARTLPDPDNYASQRPVCWYAGGVQVGTVDESLKRILTTFKAVCLVYQAIDNRQYICFFNMYIVPLHSESFRETLREAINRLEDAHRFVCRETSEQPGRNESKYA